PYFVLSITSTATTAYAASTVRGFAREPHVFTECERDRVSVRAHRVVSERVTVPGLHVDASGRKACPCGKSKEQTQAVFHGFLAACFSKRSSTSLMNAARLSIVRSPLW